MTKTLIKPMENEDFCEAQNPRCELRPALLSDPDGAGINPPPFIWMAGWEESDQNSSGGGKGMGSFLIVVIIDLSGIAVLRLRDGMI